MATVSSPLAARRLNDQILPKTIPTEVGGAIMTMTTGGVPGSMAQGVQSAGIPTTLPRRFEIVRRLRQTMYGETLLCRDHHAKASSSNRAGLVVVKRLGLVALRENLVGGHEDPLQERAVIDLLWRTGGHPRLVRYAPGPATESMFVTDSDLGMIMEYCPEGDLYDFAARQPEGRVPEDQALRLVREIAEGLEFLHGHGVAHRDVSLENVLLQRRQAKLCDFGLSCPADRRYRETVGKLYYMAPEVAHGDYYWPRPADLWSLGIVLFVLLTGSPLVADERVRDKTYRVIERFGVAKILALWGLEDLYRPATVAFLDELLQVDPTRRPSIATVVAHPVFNPMH